MASAFSYITRFVRNVIGDTDTSAYQYSDDVIGDHLRLVLFELNETNLQEDYNNPGYFTTTLTGLNTARMIFRTVLSVIAGCDNHFSYQTPVLSIVRKGGVKNLLSSMLTRLDELEGGNFPCSSDTELQAIVSGMQRYIYDFANAFSELTGDSLSGGDSVTGTNPVQPSVAGE